EDGIRDRNVTGVQTCALPILALNQIFDIISVLLYSFHALPTIISKPPSLSHIGWNNQIIFHQSYTPYNEVTKQYSLFAHHLLQSIILRNQLYYLLLL